MSTILIIALIVVGPILIGMLIEQNDKAKSEDEERKKNELASKNRSNRSFMEKHPFSKDVSLVKLCDYRWTYIKRDSSYLNSDIFYNAEDFANETVIVNIVPRGYNIMNNEGKYMLPFPSKSNLSYYIERIFPEVYIVSARTEIKKDYVSYEYFLVNGKGEYLYKGGLTKKPEYKDGWFTINVNGKTTRIDLNGQMEAPLFKEKILVGKNIYYVREDAYLYGLYDSKQRRMVVPCKYQRILYYEKEKLCLCVLRTKEPVWKDSKCLYPGELKYLAMDIDGRMLIDACDYEMSIVNYQYIQLLRRVADKIYYGVARFDGKILRKPEYYDVIANDDATLFFGLKENKCEVFDVDGNLLSEYNFTRDAYGMDDTITKYEHVYPSLQYGATYKNGKYSESLSCRDLYVIINDMKGKKGVLSLENKIIIPTQYDYICQVEDMSENPIAVIVKYKGRFGMRSLLSGEEILPSKFVKIEECIEGEKYYHPIHNIETSDFYESEEEMQHFDNWKKGRARFVKAYESDDDYTEYNLDGTIYIKEEYVSPKPKVIVRRNTSTTRIQKSTNTYLFFDTETTGLPKDYNAPSSNVANWPRLVQLSWIITDELGNVKKTKDFIIKPDGFNIPDSSSKIHGITNEKANREGDDVSDVLDLFVSDINRSTIIVGHNINFDKKVVGAELIRLGERDIIANKKSMCTMQLSTNFCKIPGVYGYKYPSLQELYVKLFGSEFEDAHNSAIDIEATCKCFWELKKRGII